MPIHVHSNHQISLLILISNLNVILEKGHMTDYENDSGPDNV